MKKFAIAGLIVAMTLIFSAGVALTADYQVGVPKLKLPSSVVLNSNFSKQYTMTYAQYLAGQYIDKNVGTIQVCGLSNLSLDVCLYKITGTPYVTKAAEAFGVKEEGQTWVDFHFVGDKGTLHDLGTTMAYTTNPIWYGWVLGELGSVNAGKNIVYYVKFMAVSY